MPPIFLAAALCIPFAAPTALADPGSASLPRVTERVAAHEALRIVAFGSSSTEGVGASSPAATYPIKLQTLLGDALPDSAVTVLNRGIGGQDADDFHARLSAVLSDAPDLVIFQTGTNDVLRHVPLDRFEALTRADITALRDRGIDVVLMEPQFCRVFAQSPGAFDYVESIRKIGEELRVPVIRRWDLMKAWLARHEATIAELQAGDGLHMADRGYALLAREARKTILGGAGVPVPAKAPFVAASR
ncbi:MAG TPA: SGNH/GDSL hydrolase family protein [Acetobacteraceae bacterium]|nr:SGNH/GDSL hydrolase family protein [Acetobacteraceae bacterium]